jgi:2-polyprenyl-3-methyl-5-hydroxy-6-metoxy-1,4-benzoquinol methylase
VTRSLTDRFDEHRLYMSPPAELYTDRDSTYHAGGATYTEYNYLGNWPVRTVKSLHFEAALRASRDQFGAATVIDMGCADGVFLPSLANHFPHVIGIDRRPDFIAIANDVVSKMGLTNVELICNETLTSADLVERVREWAPSVAFVLETLEHVGEASRLYESKVEFVEELFDLIAPGGRVIASVPVMIGPTFLALRATLWATGRFREPISRRNLWRAALLGRTEDMEAGWQTDDHNGFNHRKLIAALRANGFEVRDRSIGFSQLLVVTRH